MLFLDLTGAFDGAVPQVLDRVNVGIKAGGGGRPESLKTSNGGRFLWVSVQNDGGTVARFELAD